MLRPLGVYGHPKRSICLGTRAAPARRGVAPAAAGARLRPPRDQAPRPAPPAEPAANAEPRLAAGARGRRRAEPAARRPWTGIEKPRRTPDLRTSTMSDSEPERRFRPIARRAGLPKPLTQQWVNGFRVDFFWP